LAKLEKGPAHPPLQRRAFFCFLHITKSKDHMPGTLKPFTLPEYDRMQEELQTMSDAIRARPEMNHHFAERLALLAKQMGEDSMRAHPDQ
jgi:hypothetical protein